MTRAGGTNRCALCALECAMDHGFVAFLALLAPRKVLKNKE